MSKPYALVRVAAAAVLAAAFVGPVHAQGIPVFDAQNVAQAISTVAQLEQEVQQEIQLYQSMNGSRGFGALLSNPVNIRYATDARNMTVWLLHSMGRYCFVPAEGRAVLFEFPNRNCETLAAGLPGIAEVRPAKVHSFFDSGERDSRRANASARASRSVGLRRYPTAPIDRACRERSSTETT